MQVGTLLFRSARGGYSRRAAAIAQPQRRRCLTGFYVPLRPKPQTHPGRVPTTLNAGVMLRFNG